MIAESALKLLNRLALEDGRTWGSVAVDWQRADAAAVLDPAGAQLHYLTRPRGASKTTDLAAVALVLLAGLPAGAAGYCVAADRDQAALLIGDVAGFVNRSGLANHVKVDTWKASVVASGATLTALAADGASAFGLRPWVTVVDELAQWGTTPGPRKVWEAVVSAVPKVPTGRLIVLTTAGSPEHWSFKVLEKARRSKAWRVSEIPGPCPWIRPEALEEQAQLLTPSQYARLHLNRWTEAEDRLTSAADLAACAVLDGPQEPIAGVRYAVGVDLGLKNDRTALSVMHVDRAGELRRVVLDRQAVWQGSRFRPVDLSLVEAWALEVWARYNRPTFVTDPYQAALLTSRLKTKGVSVVEFPFTAQSVGRLAQRLYLLLRDRELALPNDPELLDELANVRLRETSPGVFRLDHDSDKHDDRAISLALAANWLTDQPASGPGRTGGRALRAARFDPLATRPRTPRAIRAPIGTPVDPRDSRWDSVRDLGIDPNEFFK